MRIKPEVLILILMADDFTGIDFRPFSTSSAVSMTVGAQGAWKEEKRPYSSGPKFLS